MRNVISLRSSAKCHPSRRAVAPSRKPNRAPLGHAHGLYPQATDALSTSFVPVPRCFRDGCGSRRSKSSPRHGSTVSQVLEADKKVRELAVDQSDPWARLSSTRAPTTAGEILLLLFSTLPRAQPIHIRIEIRSGPLHAEISVLLLRAPMSCIWNGWRLCHRRRRICLNASPPKRLCYLTFSDQHIRRVHCG